MGDASGQALRNPGEGCRLRLNRYKKKIHIESLSEWTTLYESENDEVSVPAPGPPATPPLSTEKTGRALWVGIAGEIRDQIVCGSLSNQATGSRPVG